MSGVFGRYALVRSLGHGDMADVWKAVLRGPSEFRKAFALKILLQELSAGRDFVDVFVEEARLLGSLAHPNIVQVTDFGEEAGRYFVATEFVHGRDLDALAKRMASRGARMPLEIALAVGVDLARALGAAHGRTGPDGLPVLHREVFPKNVLVSFHGEVKLIDFRSARVRSVAPAKLVYRSPEQSRGEALDRRSDLFSLALLVLDLATGMRPGEGPTPPRDTAAFSFPEKEASPLGEAALAVFRKALAVDRNKRYADAGELEAAFTELAGAKGLLEARRSLRATLEKLFVEEIKAEAADDPAAPLPPSASPQPAPAIARDTVSVPLTPRKKEVPAFDTQVSVDRASGSGGAVQKPAASPPPPPPPVSPSGGRVPVQPSPTANTAPGLGEAAAAGGGLFDDEPGTVSSPGEPPLVRGAPASPFDEMETENTRRPDATRLSPPQPNAAASLAGKSGATGGDVSRSYNDALFPKVKPSGKVPAAAILAGGGALVAGIIGFIAVDMLVGGGAPAATPAPEPTAVAAASAEETPAAEATPEPTKGTRTATPAKSATPRPAPSAARTTPVPRQTPAPTKLAVSTKPPATPTPAAVPVGPAGELSVKSRPFVNVFLDGKRLGASPFVKKVPAGKHKLRVTNDEEDVDIEREIAVPENGRYEVDLDLDSGKLVFGAKK